MAGLPVKRPSFSAHRSNLGVDESYRGCIFAPLMGFGDARALCQELGEGSDLATFASADEYADFAEVELNDRFGFSFWLGYRSPLGETDWTWLDAHEFTPPDDSFWKNAPVSDVDRELCAVHGELERVDAAECEDTMHFALCKTP